MGDTLGALAGGGMLALIAGLVWVFLREIGALKRETGLCILKDCGLTLGVGLCFWLLGSLIYSTYYEPPESIVQVWRIFRTPALDRMYSALIDPHWYAPVSGLFAYLGHLIGSLLSGEYILGGMLLALVLTMTGTCLIGARLRKWLKRDETDRILLLTLLIPGSIFLYLPGWLPVLYAVGAGLFYWLGRKLPPVKPFLFKGKYTAVLIILALFSALVTMITVTGGFL